MHTEGNAMEPQESYKEVANDNEKLSRRERLASIKGAIEAQGGVKSPWIDRMQKSFDWMAAHKELIKQDVGIAFNSITDKLSRVPEYAYNKYREYKRDGKVSVFTGSVDLIIKSYFGVKQLTMWGNAFVIRRAQELKSLHEHGGNVVNTFVRLIKEASELSAAHRAERERLEAADMEKSRQQINSMLRILGELDPGDAINLLMRQRGEVEKRIPAATGLRELLHRREQNNDSLPAQAA